MKKEMKLIYGFAIIVCFYTDIVQGGCLSYGHSCWGGHGKRAGPPLRLQRPPQLNVNDRWSYVKVYPDKFGLYVPNRQMHLDNDKLIKTPDHDSSESNLIDFTVGGDASPHTNRMLNDGNSKPLEQSSISGSNQNQEIFHKITSLPDNSDVENSLTETDYNNQIDDILKILNRPIQDSN